MPAQEQLEVKTLVLRVNKAQQVQSAPHPALTKHHQDAAKQNVRRTRHGGALPRPPFTACTAKSRSSPRVQFSKVNLSSKRPRSFVEAPSAEEAGALEPPFIGFWGRNTSPDLGEKEQLR